DRRKWPAKNPHAANRESPVADTRPRASDQDAPPSVAGTPRALSALCYGRRSSQRYCRPKPPAVSKERRRNSSSRAHCPVATARIASTSPVILPTEWPPHFAFSLEKGTESDCRERDRTLSRDTVQHDRRNRVRPTLHRARSASARTLETGVCLW